MPVLLTYLQLDVHIGNHSCDLGPGILVHMMISPNQQTSCPLVMCQPLFIWWLLTLSLRCPPYHIHHRKFPTCHITYTLSKIRSKHTLQNYVVKKHVSMFVWWEDNSKEKQNKTLIYLNVCMASHAGITPSQWQSIKRTYVCSDMEEGKALDKGK